MFINTIKQAMTITLLTSVCSIGAAANIWLCVKTFEYMDKTFPLAKDSHE